LDWLSLQSSAFWLGSSVSPLQSPSFVCCVCDVGNRDHLVVRRYKARYRAADVFLLLGLGAAPAKLHHTNNKRCIFSHDGSGSIVET
jgi:hypothetical protein